jgi:hypothetical protein
MAQAVSRRPLTEETRVRVYVVKWHSQRFIFRVLPFYPVNIKPWISILIPSEELTIGSLMAAVQGK